MLSSAPRNMDMSKAVRAEDIAGKRQLNRNIEERCQLMGWAAQALQWAIDVTGKLPQLWVKLPQYKQYRMLF